MTARASVCIQDGREGRWGGDETRTDTDCRVRGGRDSEVERISAEGREATAAAHKERRHVLLIVRRGILY